MSYYLTHIILLLFLLCPSKCLPEEEKQYKPILNKCCPIGKILKNKKCERPSQIITFSPEVWENGVKVNVNVTEHFDLIHEIPDCAGFPVPEKKSLASLSYKIARRLLSNGSYYLVDWTNKPRIVNTERYCVDNFAFKKNKIDVLVCSRPIPHKNAEHYNITGIGMLISCAFLLPTIVVYLLLPELRTLHGKILIGYLSSLFVSFMCFGILNTAPTDLTTTKQCIAIYLVAYFGWESAFCWLVVMSYDIWSTFSARSGFSKQKLTLSGRLATYALFAFGIPTLLTTIIVILHNSDLGDHDLLPQLGKKACSLEGKARMLYMYGPMLILNISNITFFVLTAVQIRRSLKLTSGLKSKDFVNQKRTFRQRFCLYIKLFALMGVNWIFEIISSWIETESTSTFLLILDIYNVLIGVTLFVIFVCKRKIWTLLKKRFGKTEEGISRNQTNTSSRRMSNFSSVSSTSLMTDHIDLSPCVKNTDVFKYEK